MNNYFNPVISEEMLAAWMDHNVTPAQDAYISQICSVDPDMREIMTADSQVEQYYDQLTETGFELPDELLADFTLPHIDNPVDDQIEPYPDHDDAVYHEHAHQDYDTMNDSDDIWNNHHDTFDTFDTFDA